MFYLPSYSPQLNPDEMASADIKQAVTDNGDKTGERVVQMALAAKEQRHQSLKLAEQASRFKLG